MAARSKRQQATPIEELSFEEILAQLEDVVQQLEDGEAPLEQALAVFEKGIALSRRGSRRLDEAEQRIELLLKNEDGVSTRPLDKEPATDE